MYYGGGSIKPVTQLLLALRFYASRSMQKSVSDFTGVSTSSACRIIKRVSEAIASLRPNYVNMYETIEEMRRNAEKTYVPKSKISTCYCCNRLYVLS
jgi:methylthioribose-1-phosphate isomerase